MPTPPDFTNGTALDASSLNSVGLWKVASGNLSGSTTPFVGCFSSTYDNYRIVIDQIQASAAADVYIQFLTGTTPFTTGAYSWAYTGLRVDNVAAQSATSGTTRGYTGITCTSGGSILGSASLDVYGPFNAQRTFVTSLALGYETDYYSRSGMTFCNALNAFDGFRITTVTAATLTGTATIYGYRK